MEVEFSDEAWATRNTLTPSLARVEKMRWLTPITPTIDRPDTVMSDVPLMEEIPLMGFWSFSISSFIIVPLLDGLKVLRTLMGIWRIQTG